MATVGGTVAGRKGRIVTDARYVRGGGVCKVRGGGVHVR